MFILLFSILFCFVDNSIIDDRVTTNQYLYCNFINSGNTFDLSLLTKISLSLSPCGDQDHTLHFEACQNLLSSSCPSTETYGPGSACDEYQGSYYWVGGISNTTVSSYDPIYHQFSITYHGMIYYSIETTRSLEVTYICDKSVDLDVQCNGILDLPSSTKLYKVRLSSKHACPVEQPSPHPHDGGLSSVGLSTGSIVLIVFATLIVGTSWVFGILTIGPCFVCFGVMFPIAAFFCTILLVVGAIGVCLAFGSFCCCTGIGTGGSGILVLRRVQGSKRRSEYIELDNDKPNGTEKTEN